MPERKLCFFCKKRLGFKKLTLEIDLDRPSIATTFHTFLGNIRSVVYSGKKLASDGRLSMQGRFDITEERVQVRVGWLNQVGGSFFFLTKLLYLSDGSYQCEKVSDDSSKA